jgi:hypothetical protein
MSFPSHMIPYTIKVLLDLRNIFLQYIAVFLHSVIIVRFR